MYADEQEMKEQMEFCKGCKFFKDEGEYWNPNIVCTCEDECPREKKEEKKKKTAKEIIGKQFDQMYDFKDMNKKVEKLLELVIDNIDEIKETATDDEYEVIRKTIADEL